MGFPPEAVCSSQHVPDRTGSSMTRVCVCGGGGVSVQKKSNDRYFPPPPPPPPLLLSVRAPRLLPTGAPRLDCTKKGITSRRRDARRCRYQTQLRARGVQDAATPLPQIGDDGTFLSVAVGALPFASKPLFPLRLIHTPRRQSELQPDWRQTRRGGETAHRSPPPVLCCSSWLWQGGAQNPARIKARDADGIPDTNYAQCTRLRLILTPVISWVRAPASLPLGARCLEHKQRGLEPG